MTDRPDFTEASSTVGRGVLQVENGYTFRSDKSGGVRTNVHSFPESLFRLGVFAEWLELRIQPNYAVETSGGARLSGADDLYLGAKIGLTPQEGILPELALMPQMFVPVGADEFTAHEVLPGVVLLYGWDVTENISTAGQTLFNRALDDTTGAAYTRWATSWTAGYKLTERLGGYTEFFTIFPHSADTVLPQSYFDGGFTYLLSNDVQFDIRAGVGLNEHADDFFVGTGLSFRFKRWAASARME